MLLSGSGRRSSTEVPLHNLSLRWLNNRLRSYVRKYMIRDHDYFRSLCLGLASLARMFKALGRRKNRIEENNRGPSPMLLCGQHLRGSDSNVVGGRPLTLMNSQQRYRHRDKRETSIAAATSLKLLLQPPCRIDRIEAQNSIWYASGNRGKANNRHRICANNNNSDHLN